MREDFSELQVLKNDATSRFELVVDGHTAFIDFKEKENKIWLIHTEAPEALKGRGVATALIEKTLNYLEANNFKLVPLCPLVAAFIKRHAEWNRIVA